MPIATQDNTFAYTDIPKYSPPREPVLMSNDDDGTRYETLESTFLGQPVWVDEFGRTKLAVEPTDIGAGAFEWADAPLKTVKAGLPLFANIAKTDRPKAVEMFYDVENLSNFSNPLNTRLGADAVVRGTKTDLAPTIDEWVASRKSVNSRDLSWMDEPMNGAFTPRQTIDRLGELKQAKFKEELKRDVVDNFPNLDIAKKALEDAIDKKNEIGWDLYINHLNEDPAEAYRYGLGFLFE